MTIATYSDLLAASQSWAGDRTDADFTGQFPNFLMLAEARIYEGGDDIVPSDPLRSKVMDIATTIVMTNGSGDLPDDVLDVRKIYREPERKDGLEYLDPMDFELFAATYTTGDPSRYTIEGETLRVAPSYTGDLKFGYWQRPVPLTVSTPINPVLTDHPGIYLTAVLFEAFSWMQEIELAQGHLARLKSQIAGANRVARDLRLPGQLRMRSARAIV